MMKARITYTQKSTDMRPEWNSDTSKTPLSFLFLYVDHKGALLVILGYNGNGKNTNQL